MNRPKKTPLPKYLGYALPRADGDNTPQTFRYADLELDDVPLCAQISFIDYEGVALFAGAFESIKNGSLGGRFASCIARSALDLREREFYTTIQKGKYVVFLVPDLPDCLGYDVVDPSVDLFRRVLHGMGVRWKNCGSPVAHIQSETPEFQEFIERYGTAHIHYYLQGDVAKRLCGTQGATLGFAIAGKVFVLPCAYPQTHEQAVEMAITAIRAAREYRERIKEEFPEWVAEYRFGKEDDLMATAEGLRGQLLAIESEIDVYRKYKGALCFRSDPLVQVVAEVFHDFFDIDLEIDEKCVEDATLRDDQGSTLAVFEIKGVNSNFTRQNVNQVDSHRERLSLSATTPGLLIMNTIMSADSLADKDQPPHPDIIKKAVVDRVLLLRTLDLLRCADLCQGGLLTKDDFRKTLLNEAGWLKVDDKKMTTVTR